jgi:hypothetical protein
LWKINDSKHATIRALAAEKYMVDRGASLTFVRRIELMEQSSIKIIAPFRVRGAGENMFARLAGRLRVLYLEDGEMLVIDSILHPRRPFNMISAEGQLCDLPDYYSVADNHGDGLAAWELRKNILKGKTEGGLLWI